MVVRNLSNIMCDRNVNTWFGPRSSSNFLRQRKITYVDNPFDEQASASMLNYDLTYLNRPAKAHETAKKELSPSSSRSGELFDEDNKDGEREEIWNFSSQGDQSCDMSDWSYLFAPVQVNVIYYSVKIQTKSFLCHGYCM